MKKRILPIVIVAISLAMVSGLIITARSYAASTSTALSAGPAPDTHELLSVEPLAQGRFAQAGATTVFQVAVTNTGASPTDTYELSLTSNWPAALYGPDGATPLSDTNGSGSIDTGLVPIGQVFTITAKIETPPAAMIGDANETTLNIDSVISPTLNVDALMQSAVPAPFAQTLYQKTDRAMNLIMAQPDGAWQQQTTPDAWFSLTDRSPELAASETFSGYVYAWNNFRNYGAGWMSEVEYQLTEKTGAIQKPIAKLTDHSSTFINTFDYEPAVAVAPDGRIGVAWFREIVHPNNSKNLNVHLAILNPSGVLVTDTINLSGNAGWRLEQPPAFDVPVMSSPRIAATGDNHFLVAWATSIITYTEKVTETSNVDDLYYAIRDTDGLSVTGAVNLSQNVPGDGSRSIAPALTPVAADRVLITWNQRRAAAQGGDDILYTVLDSSGSTVKATTELSDDGLINWYNYDVVTLSSGDIVAAWEGWGCPGYGPLLSPRIAYAVIKSSNYNRFGQPHCLPPTVEAVDGDSGASLVADNQNRAILTWTDDKTSERQRLYYALIKANGVLVTEPMIFYQNRPAEGLLDTGSQGYASASRIFLDAAIGIDPVVADGAPNNAAEFKITARNMGTLTGTGAVVTLTLAPSLTYDMDNAPGAPTVDEQQIIWSLPDLLPWSQSSFDVQVAVSATAEFLSSYPLTVTISVDEAEATLTNNMAQAQVKMRRPLYLPAIAKNE